MKSSKFNPVRDAEMFSRSLKPHFIPPGDIKAMVGWLEMPKNHNAAADAIAFAPDSRKDDAFVDFIATAPEFQGWDRSEIQAALDQANDQHLMKAGNVMENKTKTTKGTLGKLVAEAVQKGLAKALKERKASKVTKISSAQLAEGIRKAVKKVLKEMHATDIVGWAGEGYVVCPEHISEKEAEAEGMNPVFATEEGWEDMTCDVRDKEYAELAGNRLGIHTLGQVAGISENTMASPGRAGSGRMSGGAMPPPGKGAVAGTAAPTQEGVSDGDKVRGRSSFGQIPSPEELQQAIDDLGGWDMNLRGSDLEAFIDAVEAAGMSQMKAMCIMNTGEGMARVLDALMSSGDENAESLASSIMDVLGWEWV